MRDESPFSRMLKRARSGERLVGGLGRMTLFALSTNGRVCVISDGQSLTSWSTVSGEFEFRSRLEQPVDAVALSPDGQHVAVARGSDIQLHSTLDLSIRLEELRAPGRVSVLAESSKGLLAAGGSFGVALYRDGTVRELPEASKVTRLAFTAEGDRLVTGSGDGTVAVWDVGSVTQLETVSLFDDAVVHLGVSSNGEWLAAASRYNPFSAKGDSEVHVLSLEGLERVQSFNVGPGCLAFRPGTDQLAIVEGDHRDINLYSVETEELVTGFNAHGDTNLVIGMAFTPDGMQLLSASSQAGTVVITELSDSEDPRRLAAIEAAWEVTGRLCVHRGGIVYETREDEDSALRRVTPDGAEVPAAWLSKEARIQGIAVVDPTTLLFVAGSALNVAELDAPAAGFGTFFSDLVTCIAASAEGAVVGCRGRELVMIGKDDLAAVHEQDDLEFDSVEFEAGGSSEDGWRQLWVMSERRVVGIDAAGRPVAIVDYEPQSLDFEGAALALSGGQNYAAVVGETGKLTIFEWTADHFTRSQLDAAVQVDAGAVHIAATSTKQWLAVAAGSEIRLFGANNRVHGALSVDGSVGGLAFTPCGLGLVVGIVGKGIYCWDVDQLRA